MRKLHIWLIIVLVICVLATPVLASSQAIQATLHYRDINITLDGETVKPTDVNGKTVEPFIIDGTTYLPVRAISEALGCDVDWVAETNSVVITSKDAVKADDAIKNVTALGFVDTDGSKLSAIVVEYNTVLKAANVSLDDYEISDYGTLVNPACEIGGDPGIATKAYVNSSPAVSATGGTATGKYVIIEVNTDYQLAAVCKKYAASMAAGVKQIKTIETDSGKIVPSITGSKNYEYQQVQNVKPNGETSTEEWYLAKDGTYTIENIADYELHSVALGNAFKAKNCFEEQTGKYVDVDLTYALYVPEDYNPAKKYALVLHIEDAGFLSNDPMMVLTESQGPANYASAEVQQILKDDGLGGAIVVCPQIEESLRSTRDDYSVSAAVPATWQLMDYLTKTYNIDSNRIYGEGQSMGGMQVVAMAAQRDNYFAGIWANGCQWGSNFDLDDPTYNGTGYFEAPADGEIIWTKDSDGNTVNYRNWYYLVSDDNILITNCKGDAFSTSVWTELKFLYSDLAGATIPYTYWNPLTTTKAEQSAKLEKLVAQKNDLGFYWYAFDGGSHMATWIYSHGVSASYDWLLSQTRDSEMKRDKLDINKPFELAAVQLETAERSIANGSDYLVTAKAGTGTLGYNSALYGRGGGTLVQEPGWTAD